MNFVEVAIPLPMKQLFDYKIPEYLQDKIVPFMRVLVPFRAQKIIGFVITIKASSYVPEDKCKEIIKILDDFPVFSPTMFQFCNWWANYYQCSLGEALDACVPTHLESTLEKQQKCIQLTDPETVDNFIQEVQDKKPQQAKILRILKTSTEPFVLDQVRNKLNISISPFQTLEKKGIIKVIYKSQEKDIFSNIPALTKEIPKLTDEQQCALDYIKYAIQMEKYQTFLLLGITGSGKTEVYLQAIQEVVSRGKEAIVLVPEIALTPQTVSRFKQRFPKIAVLHSELTESQRVYQWKKIHNGEIQVVIGPRSALFAPTKNLGIIVVDEEHENTFKQQTTPRYNARDLAVKRGQLENAVVILGSATPSLESYYNCQLNKYTLLKLHKRIGKATLPRLWLIDMKEECHNQKRFAIFSRLLYENMKKTLAAGNKIILFLNRRGFSTIIRCKNCNYELHCSHCDIPMTFHQTDQRAICHYCGEEVSVPNTCPNCHSSTIKFLGMGTERIEETLHKLFPQAKICRMDSDTMTSRELYEKNFLDFSNGKIDILLGTQMIAKGLDFPQVTLVGILAADAALQLPDFRASERTFQLAVQVAGRAGRGEEAGLVILQSWNPEHYSIQAALKQNYEQFAQEELEYRKMMGYPPYGKLLRLLLEGNDEKQVQEKAEELIIQLNAINCTCLGPAPAAITKIKDKYRYHILIKGKDFSEIHNCAQYIQSYIQSTDKLKITIDIDPISLL